MAETPTPPPAPDNNPTLGRGPINQAWLDELTRADALITLAKEPENAGFVIDEDQPDFLDVLHTDICAARALVSKALQKSTGKKQATGSEGTAKATLIEAIGVVQKRAKQKYSGSDKEAMKSYFVGADIGESRPLLEQSAQTILDKLNGTPGTPADKLPGIDAAKITAIATALAAYKQSQTGQTDQQSDATTARLQLDKLINGPNGIAARRRQIQYAADAHWSPADATNAGVRIKFGLPKDKSLKG
jgi:hypothetical protein